MKTYKKLLSVLTAFVLLIVNCSVSISAEDEAKEPAVDGGYVNVCDFGADGNDENDDSPAFEAALATGKNLYVPKGKYYLSQTLKISDRIIRGSEPGKTSLFGKMENKSDPIVIAEGVSSVYDLYLGYEKLENVSGSNQGERVALQLGTKERACEPGSVIRSLLLQYVGTAVYNPADSSCSGVLIENLEIKFYTYRGVDMQGQNRIANSYSNLYITAFGSNKGEMTVDTGFALEGSSFSETIHQLNIEHDTYKNTAASFKNAKNVCVSVMHLEGVNLDCNDTGWIYCEKTSGYIGTLTIYFTYINRYNNSVIRFGDSDSSDKLFIGTLHNKGLNACDTPSHPNWVAEIESRGASKGMICGGAPTQNFKIFRRNKNANGNYAVDIDYYSYYYYYDGDSPYYRAFKDKSDNLTVNVLNEVKEATK